MCSPWALHQHEHFAQRTAKLPAPLAAAKASAKLRPDAHSLDFIERQRAEHRPATVIRRTLRYLYGRELELRFEWRAALFPSLTSPAYSDRRPSVQQVPSGRDL